MEPETPGGHNSVPTSPAEQPLQPPLKFDQTAPRPEQAIPPAPATLDAVPAAVEQPPSPTPAGAPVERLDPVSPAETPAGPTEPTASTQPPPVPADLPASSPLTTRAVVSVIAIALVAWALWAIVREARPQQGNENINGGVTINVNDQQQGGTVTIYDNEAEFKKAQGDAAAGQPSEAQLNQQGKTRIIAFYNNTTKDPNMLDCGRVYPLERVVEKKYDSAIINTARGLVTELTAAEKSAGWVSAIPAGTFLQQVTVSGNTARANFSGQISTMGGSCAVTAARAQISETIKKVSGANQVIICINNNCKQDEILQP